MSRSYHRVVFIVLFILLLIVILVIASVFVISKSDQKAYIAGTALVIIALRILKWTLGQTKA